MTTIGTKQSAGKAKIVIIDGDVIARRRIRQLLEPFTELLSVADTAEYAIPQREHSRPFLERIAVKTGTKSVYVPTVEIERIEADGNYVRLFADVKNYLVRSTMTKMEQALDPARFVRIHRSMIVNIDRVADVAPQFGHDFIVRLATGARVRMSRMYRAEFDRRMKHGA
jgi:two-component system LytT family response regulator